MLQAMLRLRWRLLTFDETSVQRKRQGRAEQTPNARAGAQRPTPKVFANRFDQHAIASDFGKLRSLPSQRRNSPEFIALGVNIDAVERDLAKVPLLTPIEKLLPLIPLPPKQRCAEIVTQRIV